ncbi:MAG: hypothetical protein WD342_16520 [Verrucomicrobiales bacterium]
MAQKKNTKDDAHAVEAEEHFQASKAHAEEAARELRIAAAEKARELREAAIKAKDEYQKLTKEHAEHFQHEASERIHHYKDLAEESFSDAQEKFDGYQKQGEAYVRENPFKTLLIAIAAGFILGKLFRS